MSRILPRLLLMSASLLPGLLPADDVTETLKPDRPRLLLTGARIQSLKQSLEHDSQLQTYRDRLLAHAEVQLKEPLPAYEKPDGFRLLPVSRAVLRRTQALILAWQLTGNQAYRERAKQDLFAVADFPDWNPIHFLDTAEMAAAVGLGLDALWHELSAEERETLRRAIQRHALVPYFSAHTAQRYGSGVQGVTWVDQHTNWNAVCNGGVLIAALAAAEKDDLVSMNQLRAVIAASREQLPLTLKSYDPDGAYPEGTMYWGYGSYFLALTFDALTQALGTDLGLTEAHSGISKTGSYILHAHGPSGWPLTYADAKLDRKSGSHDTARLFFANRYALPLLAGLHHQQMALPENADRITPWDLLWYTKGTDESVQLPRQAHFGGQTPLAVWRSAWNDPDAFYVSLVGGDNPGPHGHLDLGTFEVRALGELWILDPGKDDYGLPGYWETGQDGRRWTYFRLGSQGHSVPMIGGRQQRTPARAEIRDFRGGDTPGATIDLSAAYAPAKVVRSLNLDKDRKRLQVTDTFTNPAESIRWGLTLNPDAKVTIDGNTVILSLNGKQLRIEAQAPEPVDWQHRIVPPQPVGDKEAEGGSRLEFTLPAPPLDTPLSIEVVFDPMESETP